MDFVELDLQITKDDVLITNHDPCLKETTNVEDYNFMFGDRLFNGTFYPSGNTYTDDYLIRDFTLDELQILKRKQRYTDRNFYLNNVFGILTAEQAINMLLELNAQFPKDKLVGLYIETKEYQYYLDNYNINIA